MYCSKCRAELKDGSKFCSKCGSSISSPAASVNRQEETGQTSSPPEKRGELIVVLTVLLALLLAAGTGAFIYFGSRNDDAELALVRSQFSGEKESGEELSSAMTAEVPTALQTAAMPTESPTIPQTAVMPTESPTIPQTAAMPTAAPAAAASGGGAHNDRIEHIRDVYYRTVENQSGYRQEGGKYYNGNGLLVKAVVSNGNAVIDSAMRSNGYTTYSLEYYYDDTSYAESNPIFIFAVIDGKEYRYYFNNGNFIRRVGPEGSINDNPEINSFITALLDEGRAYRN